MLEAEEAFWSAGVVEATGAALELFAELFIEELLALLLWSVVVVVEAVAGAAVVLLAAAAF